MVAMDGAVNSRPMRKCNEGALDEIMTRSRDREGRGQHGGHVKRIAWYQRVEPDDEKRVKQIPGVRYFAKVTKNRIAEEPFKAASQRRCE